MRDEPEDTAGEEPVRPVARRQRKPPSGMGGFLRNFAAVSLGGAGGQVAMALSAPVLSRLYLPEDYGVSGVVIAVVMISAQIASLRYDTVILTAGSRLARANAIAITLLLEIGFCLLLAAAIGGGVAWNRATGSDLVFLAPIMLLAPVLTFAMCMDGTIAHHLLLVSGNIRRLALVNLARGVAVGGGQIGLGLMAFGPYGLVLGRLSGPITSLALSANRVLPMLREARPLVRRDRMWRVARANYRQALYQSPANVLNVVAGQTPMFLLAPLFGAGVAGSYYFINALAMMGVTFFTANASTMVLRESSRRRRHGEAVLPFVLRLTMLVAVPAFAAAVVIHVYGVPIVTTIFGERWELAGKVFTYTAFYYAAVPAFTPVSAVTQLFRNQHINMMTQLLRVAGALAAILYGAARDDYMLAIQLLTLSNVAIYLAAMAIMLITVATKERR